VELGVRDALDLEHLEPPAVEQPARLDRVARGDVAEEARRELEVVLGLVQDPRRGVDVDRLVREPAGGADRFRLAVLARPPSPSVAPAATSSVIVPPPAILSYAFRRTPNAGVGPLTSWLRTSR